MKEYVFRIREVELCRHQVSPVFVYHQPLQLRHSVSSGKSEGREGEVIGMKGRGQRSEIIRESGESGEEGERNERSGGALGPFMPTFVVSSLSFGRQSLRASKPWWISSFIEPTKKKKMLSQNLATWFSQ